MTIFLSIEKCTLICFQSSLSRVVNSVLCVIDRSFGHQVYKPFRDSQDAQFVLCGGNDSHPWCSFNEKETKY